MKQLIKTLTLIMLFTFINACDTTEPPSKETFLLKLEDVSCTEAWLQLTSTGLELPNTLTLYVDDQVNETITLSTEDTLLYIDSLLPNKTYKILAAMQQSDNASNELTLTTMDTTSQNFTWQTWTFGGEAGNCTLYDVAIINENDIWAVGEIYMLDSLGNPDPNAYNAVHWNGSQWELYKLQFFTFCGQPYTGSYPAKAIFAFDNNIIVSSGSQLTYLSGNVQIKTECVPVSVNKIWGSNGNDLYVVGNNGNIAHYQNGVWSKIESGTNLPFQDIWGAQTNTGKEQILAIASDKFGTGGKYLVKIYGNTAEHLNDIITVGVSLSGIWFIPEKKYYLVGDGIYSKHSSSERYWQFDSIIYKIQYYPYGVRGERINDVVICADAGNIAHFNGEDWRIYYGETIYDRLLSVSIKDNMIIAVGSRFNNGINNNAIIYFGKR